MVNFQREIENGFDVEVMQSYSTYHGETNQLAKEAIPRFQPMKILLILGMSQCMSQCMWHTVCPNPLFYISLSFCLTNYYGKTQGTQSIEVCIDEYGYYNLEFYVLLKTETGIMDLRKNEGLSLSNKLKMQITKVETQKEADFIFRWMAKNEKWSINFEYPLIRFLYL